MELFVLQLAIIIICIAIGGRFGGIGLGAAGGIGLFILTFIFGLEPDSPPISVMLIIISVITCVTILQAAGGLDLLVIWAEKLLRKKPAAITFIGPLVCYIFTVLCGTSYIAFSVYPVIAEIAIEQKVRPERAMSMSVVGSNMALVASPISAVVASLIAKAVSLNITLLDILTITLPGTLLGCLIGCLYVYKRGAELHHDKEYNRRLQTEEFIEIPLTKRSIANKGLAKISLLLFFMGISAIVFLSTFQQFRPSWQGNVMSVPTTLQILMLATAGLIMLCCRVAPEKLHAGSVFQSGLVGVVGIFGLSWMTGTFFGTYNDFFVDNFSQLLTDYPMLFGLILFALSILIYSPAATIAALTPLGVEMGISAHMLIALLPAACAVFIIPGGAQIACVAFDRTGTTRIGRYVINHSFMLPGMVSLIASTIFCVLLAEVIG